MLVTIFPVELFTIFMILNTLSISEYQELLKQIIASNGCLKKERISISDIVAQLADLLAENLGKLKDLKKPSRSRRSPGCPYVCQPRCYNKRVCTQECYYDCDDPYLCQWWPYEDPCP